MTKGELIMRKLTSLALSAAFAALPLTAQAAPITIDPCTATIEELEEAQQLIANRIAELTAAQTTSSSSFDSNSVIHYEGDGTSIISDISIPYTFSSVAFNAETDNNFEYHLRNADGKTISNDTLPYAVKVISGAQDGCKLLTEGIGAWTLDISPLLPADTDCMKLSGKGSLVSGIFSLDTDKIASFSIPDSDKAFFVRFYLYALRDDGTTKSALLLNDFLMSDEIPFSGDYIASPIANASQYVWCIVVPEDVEWTLEVK